MGRLADGRTDPRGTPAWKRLRLECFERDKAKGIQRHSVKLMVVGIPNVGKSSFINTMVKFGLLHIVVSTVALPLTEKKTLLHHQKATLVMLAVELFLLMKTAKPFPPGNLFRIIFALLRRKEKNFRKRVNYDRTWFRPRRLPL